MYGRRILNWILEGWDVSLWTGFMWPRTSISGSTLWIR